jgi:hypothetical protein
VVTEIPAAFVRDYDTFLFNNSIHLRLQSANWLHIYLVRKVNQKVIAEISFHITDDRAFSPLRAPFGSFGFSPDISPLLLYQFIQECESLLLNRKVKSIILKEPPLFYRASGELMHAILFNLGYRASSAEISSGIRMDHLSFEEKIETWEKRKLRQAKEKGLVFKKISVAEHENVYQFILKCRSQRGHSLSMTIEELSGTINALKSSFCLFGVYFQKELAAASIAIRVHQHILYNFYSGHLKKFDPLSPAVLLINGMYKYCATEKIQLLDLGTSALDGQPNFSLLDFKLRLGAVPSMKLTFEKELV